MQYLLHGFWKIQEETSYNWKIEPESSNVERGQGVPNEPASVWKPQNAISLKELLIKKLQNKPLFK